MTSQEFKTKLNDLQIDVSSLRVSVDEPHLRLKLDEMLEKIHQWKKELDDKEIRLK